MWLSTHRNALAKPDLEIRPRQERHETTSLLHRGSMMQPPMIPLMCHVPCLALLSSLSLCSHTHFLLYPFTQITQALPRYFGTTRPRGEATRHPSSFLPRASLPASCTDRPPPTPDTYTVHKSTTPPPCLSYPASFVWEGLPFPSLCIRTLRWWTSLVL